MNDSKQSHLLYATISAEQTCEARTVLGPTSIKRARARWDKRGKEDRASDLAHREGVYGTVANRKGIMEKTQS